MSLRISGKNLSIGESMRQHVQDRVTAATSKYFDGAVAGHVTIEPEGSAYRADCTLHLTSGITLQAEGRAHEPYASFDQAALRIEKRLRRYKSRLKNHHPAAANDGEIVASYVFESLEEHDEVPHEFSPTVIAETSSKLKQMAVSAAVMDLDFTGVPVVVFRHATTGRVNVVYRRSDGNIGWVDPSAVEQDQNSGSKS